MICPFCKKEIEPVEETTSEVSIIKDVKGRMGVWTEVTRDSDSNQVQKRVDSYSYYATGEINIINQKVFDGTNELLSDKDIKHYKDSNQPTVINRVAQL